jgi:hypothetical protein
MGTGAVIGTGEKRAISSATKDVDGRDKPGHDECLRIFAAVSSIFGRVEGTPATFHIKLFHAKEIGFQWLRKLHE